MYSILLVDDELDTLQEMAQAMDWQSCGFVLQGIAASGEEALALIEANSPDLVCTDIRMPNMDGFQLIEHAHQLNPSLAFLILSGYDEFSYAQRAVRSSVLDFLLKPAGPDTLRRSLLGIKERLDQQNALYKDLSALRRQLDQGRGLLRTAFLTELLSRQVDEGYLRQYRTETLRMEDRPFQIHVLRLDETINEEALLLDYAGQPEIAWQAIRNAVGDEFPEVPATDVLFYREEWVFYVFGGDDRTDSRSDDRLRLTVRQKLGLSVRIGVSATQASLSLARDAYDQAIRALNNPWVDSENGVCRFSDLKLDAPPPRIEANWSDLEQRIISGDSAAIAQAVQQLDQRMATQPEDAQERIAVRLELGSRLLRLAAAYGIELQERLSVFSSDEMVRQPQDWSRSFFNIARQINARIREQNTRTADGLMQEAGRYLEDHLSDPTLSLEQISSHCGVSPSHFSSLFRATYGRSFLQQVIARRLEQACLMLGSTSLKASEIAGKVGFASSSHFSYCFRKHIGVTPVEYRRGGSLSPDIAQSSDGSAT